MNLLGLSYREGYFQTWASAWRIRRLCGKRVYRGLQCLCGRLTGHEPSKTEWGYGGGRYVDRWCRWCNLQIQVPASDAPDHFRAFAYKACGRDPWNPKDAPLGGASCKS